MKRRHFTGDILGQYKIGWSAKGWKGLSKHFQKTGNLSRKAVLQSGLVIEKEDGSKDIKQETLGSEESVKSPLVKPEQIPSPEMAHRIVSGVYSVGCLEEIADVQVSAASTEINQESLDDVGQAISRYSSLFTQVVTMTVGINVQLQAGDIIKCTFPQVDREDEVDHEQGGLYIIKELSHFMSGNKSYSALKVIRDTSGD